MSGTGNNGVDDLAILIESFVEEIKPFLAGIRRGVAGIFAMPRDAQAITAARGSLGTVAASATMLDLPAARQLGELAQLLDEAFQSAERGGVPDESRAPMLTMIDHLEAQLDGLLTGDDRGRERLDNVYRLLEQVLQTVEEAEAAPAPELEIALDDLLLTLQPVARPAVAPVIPAVIVEEPLPAQVAELPEPVPTPVTELVLLSDEEVAPIEWGKKEAKLWQEGGWDESQAAYGNTGWIFMDDDDDASHAARHQAAPLPVAAEGSGHTDAPVVAEVSVAAEIPVAAELPVAAAPPVDELIVTPAPMHADVAIPDTGLLAEGVDEVLVAAPLPTVSAASTASLNVDADGLEEAALLALSPAELETYLALEPVAQRAYLETRLGEMSDFAVELGLATTPHSGGAEVTDLLAALPGTDQLLGDGRLRDTAPLLMPAQTDELLAAPKRRARKGRRAIPTIESLPVLPASADSAAQRDDLLNEAAAADVPQADQGYDEDLGASEAGAPIDGLLLTEYRPTDHGTGVLSADTLLGGALDEVERVRIARRETDRLHLSGDHHLLHADGSPSDGAADFGDESEDSSGSFLDELLYEDPAPAMNLAQLSAAADQFFGDEGEGESDPNYGAMPDIAPEIEAAFAQLSDADMAIFLSLDGDAAMAFLQGRAEGDGAIPAAAPLDVAAPAEDYVVEEAAEVAWTGGIVIDQEILEVFLQEMQELLATWVDTASKLRLRPADTTLMADLRRAAHTVKGAARMVGFELLGTVGWRVEDVLDQIDEHGLATAAPVLDFIDRSYLLVQRLSADTTVDSAAFADQDAALEAWYTRIVAEIKANELATPRAEEGEDLLVNVGPTAEGEQDNYVDEEIDDELLGVFVQEADDHLAAFNRALVALDRNPADSGQALEAKRVVHTLKGASAALGYPVTAALCHSVEDLFEQIDTSGRPPTREMLTLFFESAETLEALMAGITAGQGENAGRALALRSRYAAFLNNGAQASQPEADTVVHHAPIAGADDASQRGGEKTARSVRVDIAHLDNLLNLVGELVINRTSQEQHLERLGRTVNELLLSVDRLRRVGFQLESRYEVAELLRGDQRRPVSEPSGARLRLLGPQSASGEEEFDSLEMDRYTELHRISRELVEIAADINTAGTELDGLYDNFDQTLSRQGRIAADLQDRMMEVRLVPIATLAARLYRAVRGVAQRRSRRVELVIEGETVEIDKMLLEEITDPLLHLVRNAADHGIESAQDRAALGKPATGTVKLSAAREGNEAVIRVSDDGAGIDLDRVLEKALARGVIRQREGLTRAQILDLLFLPGFSTSPTINDISGRGVGLDVVRTNVRRLKGTIDIDSTPGIGTTFTIRLPIMLAVTRALLIRTGVQTFAIPLPVVEQVAFFRKEQVATVGGGDLIDLGGATYPVVYLSRALGLADSSDSLSSGARALIVGNADRRIALVVDELVGQQEIVVKQLGRHLQSVAGVAGATILGNGQVVLILNVLDLIGDRRARPVGAHSAALSRSPELGVAPQPQPLRPIGAARGVEGPRVAMIVDDSLSVRRVLTRTLERDGWQVIGAKDGVEALEMLAWANPRVMVLDIEMPRMDGYELTSLIRNHPDHHDLPIAMLTSRAGDKHRRKAEGLGVSAYLVKPFEESELLRTVRELSTLARQSARNAG